MGKRKEKKKNTQTPALYAQPFSSKLLMPQRLEWEGRVSLLGDRTGQDSLATHLTHLNKPAALLHVHVQLVQIQRCLRDRRAGRDRGPSLVHVRQQLVQKHAPVRLVVHLVQLVQAVRFLLNLWMEGWIYAKRKTNVERLANVFGHRKGKL